MADKYYGVNRGEQTVDQVSVDSSSTGKQFELRINDSAFSFSKADIDHAIVTIQAYLRSRESNPIG